MVLVDTSVWIRAFSGRDGCQQQLDRLLADDDVLAHELVFGELLIGDAGGRTLFLSNYDRMHYAPCRPHRDVVALVRQHKLYGRGAGWIDVHLLAAALGGGHRLWTTDARLGLIADKLEVAYHWIP